MEAIALSMIGGLVALVLLLLRSQLKQFLAQQESLISTMNRQFSEVREETNRQHVGLREEMNRQFSEMREDMNRQFSKVEARQDTTSSQLLQVIGTQERHTQQLSDISERLLPRFRQIQTTRPASVVSM